MVTKLIKADVDVISQLLTYLAVNTKSSRCNDLALLRALRVERKIDDTLVVPLWPPRAADKRGTRIVSNKHFSHFVTILTDADLISLK